MFRIHGRLGRAAGAWLALSLAAVGLTVFSPGPSEAGTQVVADGNDVKGKLDIKRAKATHTGEKEFRHTLITYDGWKVEDLNNNDGLFLALDTDCDQSDVEFWIVVVREGKRLDAYRTNSNFVILDDTVKFGHPTARKLWIKITSTTIAKAKGYSWGAATLYKAKNGCKNGCVDSAPNDELVVHDFTAPEIQMFPVPDVTTTYSTDETVGVQFDVDEDGCSGLRDWLIRRRVVGATSWETVATAPGAPSMYHKVPVEQGSTYQIQILVADNHGNEDASPIIQTTAPWDDGNAALVSGYSGDWTEVTSTFAYLEKVHQSSTPGDSFSFSYIGTRVGWIAPGGANGVAEVSVDGGPPALVSLASFSGPRQLVFSQWVTTGPHDISITVISGTVSIDGILVRA